MPPLHPVRLEVLPTNGKHFTGLQHFHDNDQQSVCKVYRVIGLLVHQLEGTLYPCVVHEPDERAAFENRISAPIDSVAPRGEPMKRLGQY